MLPLTQLEAVRKHTARLQRRLGKAPVHMVPTMTAAELARAARKELPELYRTIVEEVRTSDTQTTERTVQGTERLVPYTTARGSHWTVLVRQTEGALQVTALLRYHTPDLRLRAVCMKADESGRTTAHHYGPDVLLPILNRMGRGRDAHKQLGKFLLYNHDQHCDVVAQVVQNHCTVLASVQDELVKGTWDKENDVVNYTTRFDAAKLLAEGAA